MATIHHLLRVNRLYSLLSIRQRRLSSLRFVLNNLRAQRREHGAPQLPKTPSRNAKQLHDGSLASCLS